MNNKIILIVDFFKFKNFDDATIRLDEVIVHYQRTQKKLDINASTNFKTENNNIQNHLIDTICKRIINSNGIRANYIPLNLHCSHFTYLLIEIGKYYNHDCIGIEAKVEYYDSDKHHLVEDKTQDRYRDATIYGDILLKIRLNPCNVTKDRIVVEKQLDFN